VESAAAARPPEIKIPSGNSYAMHLPQKFQEISEIPLEILENLYKCYFLISVAD